MTNFVPPNLVNVYERPGVVHAERSRIDCVLAYMARGHVHYCTRFRDVFNIFENIFIFQLRALILNDFLSGFFEIKTSKSNCGAPSLSDDFKITFFVTPGFRFIIILRSVWGQSILLLDK